MLALTPRVPTAQSKRESLLPKESSELEQKSSSLDADEKLSVLYIMGLPSSRYQGVSWRSEE